jgi:osmotically-inducible protein OsmY
MKTKPASSIPRYARRALLVGALAAVCVPLLQSCLPLAVVGIGAGALMVADRRSSGAIIDDESIEWKVADLIRKNFGTVNHVNATSYNRNVLLTGEVQSEHVRTEVQRLASSVANVRTVVNELVVGPPSSLSARGNDSLITTNVKTLFVGRNFAPNHVKVLTEANVVFLLGIVTRAEGHRAVEIARTGQGVKNVITVFEFVNEDDPRVERTRPVENNLPEAL